ncbi:interleukin-1 receptor antagonist protein-like isoform X2 [Tamandua tetradactyla]|uniref:interleukin-1 receptor antagonist protein-like isoform X2 n=1 Tax=Tamandua tetradactyla TaxID=48850 RepID=UPI0040547811
MAREAVCRPSGKRPCRMQVQVFRIWDVNQKTFYMRDNQLVAGYLQGANAKLEERITVVPAEPHTLLLGIHGGRLGLACVRSGGQARLRLEEVNMAELAKNKEQAQRFTFIRSDSGSTTSFESAACPGWFLCTAPEADQPVGLTNVPGEPVAIIKFYFQQDR